MRTPASGRVGYGESRLAASDGANPTIPGDPNTSGEQCRDVGAVGSAIYEHISRVDLKSVLVTASTPGPLSVASEVIRGAPNRMVLGRAESVGPFIERNIQYPHKMTR